MNTTIQKWGNSYAVRLPMATIHRLNLRAGHSVEIRESIRGESISIIPVKKHADSLTEMLSRITDKNRHGVVDWGKAVDREVW